MSTKCCGSFYDNKNNTWFGAKTLGLSATVLIISVVAITAIALISHFPITATVLYSVFGVASFFSLIALTYACSKNCGARPQEHV